MQQTYLRLVWINGCNFYVVVKVEADYVRREALKRVQPAATEIGQLIYHFSNIQHPAGYTGHKGMFFTTDNYFYSQTSEVDPRKMIYRHTCEVTDPSKA
jgi:hypothetical protein